jgi:chemotaxis signal transduction protein
VNSLSHAGEVLSGFVLFNINKTEFAVDIKIVESILHTENFKDFVFTAYHNIPLTVEYNNESFHLLNLHKLLKYNAPKNVVNTRIILLNVDNHRTAILVDNIKEFVTANNKTYKFLKVIPVNDMDNISGKIIYEGRTILILDLNKITRVELINHHLET